MNGVSRIHTVDGGTVRVAWNHNRMRPARDAYRLVSIDDDSPVDYAYEFVAECLDAVIELNPGYPSAGEDITPTDENIWCALGCRSGSVGEMVIDGCINDEWRHAERAKAWRAMPVAERHQAMAFAGCER